MRYVVLVSLVIASVLTVEVAARELRQPSVSPNHDTSILSAPAGYEKPASDALTTLGVVARCSATRPRGVDVTLAWSVKHEGVAKVRVDVTAFRDGFQSGRFETLGERPTGDRRLEFPDAVPGVYYYWRLLVRRPAGWTYAGNGRFDVPVCPADDEERR